MVCRKPGLERRALRRTPSTSFFINISLTGVGVGGCKYLVW